MTTAIKIANISRSFNHQAVLNDVSLTVQPCELLALLGPSGSGKTTLLRLIAGLDTPDTGSITIDGDDAASHHPTERGVGFVFQHYALFRHMSVFENIAFPLRIRKTPKSVIQAKVQELLQLIQLENLAGRYPAQLSGGQRQRVALARALASQPRVLLLDEPFGALDAVVRRELRRWLRKLHKDMSITTIFVTHDQEEAFDLADRVVIMKDGRICQQGTPLEIYQHPTNAFVHEFLGESNHIPVQVQNGEVTGSDGHAFGLADIPDGPASLFIRPHHILPVTGHRGQWGIERITTSGAQAHLHLIRGSVSLDASMTADALLESGLASGDDVNIRIIGGTVFADHFAKPVRLSQQIPVVMPMA